MQVLVQDLQEMNRITDLDVAIRFAMQTMCKTHVCDRSVYWVIDERRQSAWTRMPNESGKMNIIAIPLTTGFVSVCYKTKKAVNVADAYADSRFSRAYDVRTGYRTKAVLSIPVLQNGKVKAVQQCTNKLSASTTVFDDEDVFVLYVIGHAMANVVTNCEKHKDTMHATRRRDTLLAAAEDFFLRCRSKRDLLTMLRERMAHLFHAQDCVLALVYENKLERLDLDLDGNIHSREQQPGSGLLGACVVEKNPLHVERPRSDRRFHPSIDIGVQGSQRLHS
jgi:signal transduction protein with GAF and PtsI domain